MPGSSGCNPGTSYRLWPECARAAAAPGDRRPECASRGACPPAGILPAMPELILVKAADCLALRERVLRPGQPASAYTYAADNDARALHFGLRAGKQLIGVASLLPEARGAKAPGGAGPETWRLRGMAVD